MAGILQLRLDTLNADEQKSLTVHETTYSAPVKNLNLQPSSLYRCS